MLIYLSTNWEEGNRPAVSYILLHLHSTFIIWKYCLIKRFLKWLLMVFLLNPHILPCPWALLGCCFLIILLTCLTEKSTDVKMDSVWVKSCWQLAIIDKGRALSYKIWIKKPTIGLNFRYKFVIMVYWWYIWYFFNHPIIILQGTNIFWVWELSDNLNDIFRIFPFSLIDFCVIEIFHISKVKLKTDWFYYRVCFLIIIAIITQVRKKWCGGL